MAKHHHHHHRRHHGGHWLGRIVAFVLGAGAFFGVAAFVGLPKFLKVKKLSTAT